MHHLAAGVNAGVGSSGAVYGHRVIGHPAQRPLQALLNGGRLALPLPAVNPLPSYSIPAARRISSSAYRFSSSSRRASAAFSGPPSLATSSSTSTAESISPEEI